MSIAIRADNLGKRYRLGATHAGSIRELVNRTWKRLLGRKDGLLPHEHVELQALVGGRVEPDGTFWALRDVSLEVEPGEVIGVIGRNGSGKSTLLKILSQITAPTTGRVELHGRVASLLEVGTGFHPELSGRENIFLNGAILGMSKAEIRRKFDEIVAFAEMERFLDTPVKRYSSGMYVRLAFAVAAHLESEILIIDEVLAVGDYEFQRRCLGQMQEVAHCGRTVLFVSHNMHAIEELCSRSILLKNGRIARQGATSDVVAHYLSSTSTRAVWEFDEQTNREGTGSARIARLELLAAETDTPLTNLTFRQSFRLRIHYHASKRLLDPRFGVALLTEKDERVFLSETTEVRYEIPVIEGPGWVDCLITAPNLLPGLYFLEAWIFELVNSVFADHVRMVGKVEIQVDPGQQERLTYLTYPNRGRVLLDCRWFSPDFSPSSQAGGPR